MACSGQHRPARVSAVLKARDGGPCLTTRRTRVFGPAMPRSPHRRLWLLLLCCFGCTAQAQVAAPVAGHPGLAPAQAQQVLDLLRDDKRRAEFTATLDAIVKAAPSPPLAAPPLTGAPAIAAPTIAATAAEAVPAAVSALPLAPDSLGAQLLTQASEAITRTGAKLAASVQSVNDLPLLWRWTVAQAVDPDARARLGDAGWKLLVVLACAVATEWVVRRLLRPLRGALGRWAPASPDADAPDAETRILEEEAAPGRPLHSQRLTRAVGALWRLPSLLGRLLLDVVPVGVSALVATLLAGTGLGQPPVVRQAILEAVQAYAGCRAVLVAAALLVSPAIPRLRLLHVSDWAAAFLTRWTRRIAVLGAAGYGMTEVGLVFGMYRTAHDALLKLFSLAIHLCLLFAVLQARRPVAQRIRCLGQAHRAWAPVLSRLADIWHLVAIFYIVALWLVWAAELRNGYVRLIHFCAVTSGVLVASRLVAVLVLGGLDRLQIGRAEDEAASGLQARAAVYYPLVRSAFTLLLSLATGFALLEAWGFAPIAWFSYGGLGARSASATLTIGTAVVLAVLVWEGANAGLERHVARLTESAQLARAGRLRTLLPMLRTVLLVTIVLVVVLMALSELGVNIAPLLAGAGVVGIAVGFGSQKLVQDLITGLFLLLENAMQVGDVVTLGGLTGTVEALSIRTIRLRAVDGSVHLIPFSAVTTVTNQTRDYSYAVLDVSVGLNEEPAPIADVLRGVAEEMRADPAWATAILEPLDVMGVERFVDTAWVMRVRIKTQPGSRWGVSRELNRRIKLQFDAMAIESPITSYRVLGTQPQPSAIRKEEEAA